MQSPEERSPDPSALPARSGVESARRTAKELKEKFLETSDQAQEAARRRLAEFDDRLEGQMERLRRKEQHGREVLDGLVDRLRTTRQETGERMRRMRGDERPGVKHLRTSRLEEMLERNEDFHLIDVRPEVGFQAKHVPGSANVPLAEGRDFVERVVRLTGDRDARIVVYCACQECDASARAATRLEAAGFREVYDYAGGLEEWERAGLPLRGREARIGPG